MAQTVLALMMPSLFFCMFHLASAAAFVVRYLLFLSLGVNVVASCAYGSVTKTITRPEKPLKIASAGT